MTQFRKNTNRICYMILPDGIKEDLAEGLAMLSEKHGISIVVIDEVDWNNDLTPWPEEGVFRKAKPFGGKAALFLDKLISEIVPNAEKRLGIEEAERTILGVSLSGLFAIWAMFETDTFTNIISISGSLWYDGFVGWMKENTPSTSIRKVCMLLGEKEKHTKEKRMAAVEDRTVTAADVIRAKSRADVMIELVEGTHFSPIMPRLERAFEVVYGL